MTTRHETCFRYIVNRSLEKQRTNLKKLKQLRRFFSQSCNGFSILSRQPSNVNDHLNDFFFVRFFFSFYLDWLSDSVVCLSIFAYFASKKNLTIGKTAFGPRLYTCNICIGYDRDVKTPAFMVLLSCFLSGYCTISTSGPANWRQQLHWNAQNAFMCSIIHMPIAAAMRLLVSLNNFIDPLFFFFYK